LSVISEFLRPQQSVEKIDAHQYADDEHDHRLNVHDLSSLHPVAEAHVPQRQREEHNRKNDEQCILHGLPRCLIDDWNIAQLREG
jgi:hypothetical protein